MRGAPGVRNLLAGTGSVDGSGAGENMLLGEVRTSCFVVFFRCRGAHGYDGGQDYHKKEGCGNEKVMHGGKASFLSGAMLPS